MRNFSRKGAKAQTNTLREAKGLNFAPLRLCVKSFLWIALSVTLLAPSITAYAQGNDYLFNDTHFHLTNYIQEGIDIEDFLKVMGNKVGRVALFGIPLQQQWSYRVDEDRGPTYYLNSDAPLYYYSFTDAWIATAYKSLPKEDQARFDPMITRSEERRVGKEC